VGPPESQFRPDVTLRDFAERKAPVAEQVGVARNREMAEALAPLFVGQNTFDERASVLPYGDPGEIPRDR
jgi:hypothetical protein